MRGERGRQLLPLAQEPRHLLLGGRALAGDRPHPIAVRVETWIGEERPELLDAPLELVDLPLDVLEARPERLDLGTDVLLAKAHTVAGPAGVRRWRGDRRRRGR